MKKTGMKTKWENWEGHRCQFVFASSVLSVMSVNGFPLIIMSAHAQCSICTCSVVGIPSLVCLHMLSVGPSLISMQCKHCKHVVMFTNKRCLHCILMREGPTLSMCRHTNEGIPSTEHVQMLCRACADIIMRGNPLTDMTDNTNWQCLHTREN